MTDPCARTAGAVLDLVLQLQIEHGLTVVLATHDLAVAQRADRIVALASGRITDDRST